VDSFAYYSAALVFMAEPSGGQNIGKLLDDIAHGFIARHVLVPCVKFYRRLVLSDQIESLHTLN
jgi:hypothetical protein